LSVSSGYSSNGPNPIGERIFIIQIIKNKL